MSKIDELCPMPKPTRQQPRMDRDYFNNLEMGELRKAAVRAAYEDAIVVAMCQEAPGAFKAADWNRAVKSIVSRLQDRMREVCGDE